MKEFKKHLKKFPLFLILVILLLHYLGLAEASPGSLAEDYLLEAAKNFYRRGNYQDALHEFKKVIIINPTNEEANYYIELIGKVEEAVNKELLVLERESEIIKQRGQAQAIPGEPKPGKNILGEDKYTQREKETMIEMALAMAETELIAKAGITAGEKPSPASLELETEEPPVKVVSLPTAIKRAGEISLFVDGQEVSMVKPIIVEEGTVMLPLREVTSKLYSSLLDLAGGNYKIISPDGISKEIEASLIDGEPMISEQQLKDYFSVEGYFDEPQKAFHIRTKSPLNFETYLIEKPAEEIRKEELFEEMAKKVSTGSERPTYIPDAARPSVQLRGSENYSIIKYHVAPTYHSLMSSLYGTAYDFKVDYQSSWKDINGVFDHDYTYLNLSKPGLYIGLFDQSIELYPLRGQSQSFTGLKVISEWQGSNKTTLVGGETENTSSGTAGSVKYLGKMYGIGQEFAPLQWLDLESTLFYLENKTELPELSGTTSFPRNNLVSFNEASLRLPHDLSVSAQLVHSDYSPDNEPGNSVEDWSWRVGPEMDKKRYKLGLAYEFAGDKYASLGDPASYRDYSGWNLYSDYNVTDNWSLSGDALYYHNNVEGDPNMIRTDNTSLYLTSRHQLTKEQSLYLGFNRLISNPSGPDCGFSSETNDYSIDYSSPFLFNSRTLLSYQYDRTDSPGGLNSYAHTPGFSLFKSFGKGSSWYLSQQFIKTIYETQANELSSLSAFNINYVFNPLLNLYENYSYTRTKTQLSKADNVVSSATGLRYRLFPDTWLSCEYNINSYNLNTEKDRWPRNWSIMASVSQAYEISTPPNFGVIEGGVYKDINANGKFDHGDSGVGEATIYLEDKRDTATNAQGYYKFLYVTPGRQKVHLDLSSIPPEWTAQEPDKEVEVKGRRKSKLNFLVVKSSSIKGKVFVDDNSDSIFQESEEPLDNIAIILMPGEQIRMTNTDGDFNFDYLLPGKYKLKIRTKDLPIGYELVSKEEIALDLPAGEEIKNIYFIVRLSSAPLKKSN